MYPSSLNLSSIRLCDAAQLGLPSATRENFFKKTGSVLGPLSEVFPYSLRTEGGQLRGPSGFLCRDLCRNPAIPTGVGASRCLSLGYR
jgi:hypothetical protein